MPVSGIRPSREAGIKVCEENGEAALPLIAPVPIVVFTTPPSPLGCPCVCSVAPAPCSSSGVASLFSAWVLVVYCDWLLLLFVDLSISPPAWRPTSSPPRCRALQLYSASERSHLSALSICSALHSLHPRATGGGMLGECRPGSASPACPSEGAGGRSAERSWPLMCRAAAPARGPRAYPARLTSSEHACPTSGLLCGRLLVALVESVWRPRWVGEYVSFFLMRHCVSVCVTSMWITSTVDPSKRYTRSYHAGRLARTELCAGTQKSRAARRARWGARTARGAHPGFGSPP